MITFFANRWRWPLLRSALGTVAILCVCSAGAEAAGVELTSAVFHEVEVESANGSTAVETVPATTVVPGTEVIYVVSYRNSGSRIAENIEIVNPVPENLEYIRTIGHPAAEVSVDGGEMYGLLADLTVADSAAGSRPARAADVTHLRWVLDALEPGAGGKVSFSARVK